MILYDKFHVIRHLLEALKTLRKQEFKRAGKSMKGLLCGKKFLLLSRLAHIRGKAREALTRLLRPARKPGLAFGFNEWFRAQDGSARGQDWQSWSAAMYLYAAACVEQKQTPFLPP